MNFLIFGAGAIGTYLGGSLIRAGQKVTFLEGPEGLAQLRRQGLSLDLTVSGDAVFSLSPGSFTCHSNLEEALQARSYDLVLLALKSFDTAAALQSIAPFSAQIPTVLCFSNGVENEAAVASVLGKDSVIAGTITSSVGRQGVGRIVLERKRGMGIASGHPLSEKICPLFTEAGLNAHLYPDAAAMKWSKLLTNLPGNATAAILDMTAGEVYSHPGLVRLERRMLAETLKVMHALGLGVIDLPGVPTRMLALGVRLPFFIARPLLKIAIGGGRGGKMPSFHIDLYTGRGKSEVDWLNGAVARIGRQQGIAAPVNETLTRILTDLTNGVTLLNRYSRKPEELIAAVTEANQTRVH